MLEAAQTRLKAIYQSPRGEVWDRIEDEDPEGYLENNVVNGRRRAVILLLRWMEPIQGRRVLDLGCGRGSEEPLDIPLRVHRGDRRVAAGRRSHLRGNG